MASTPPGLTSIIIEVRPKRVHHLRALTLLLWLAFKLLDADYRVTIDGQTTQWTRPRLFQRAPKPLRHGTYDAR